MMHMTYLDWLKAQVTYFDGPKFDNLLEKMYSIPYVAVIDKDENRYADGIALRDEYFKYVDDDPTIIDTPCSFLEFLVALARRMSFIYSELDEDRTQDCFWRMVANMGFRTDRDIDLEYEPDVTFTEEAIEQVVNRDYAINGVGGLFPLKHPRENQRNVEIWYQMNQYLKEIMHEEGRL